MKLQDTQNPHPLQIRSATPEDFESLRLLSIADFDWNQILSGNNILSNYEIVCLQSNQAIEGVAVAQLEADTSAMIQTIYVSPKYRRCYYGSQLLQTLLQRLQQRNITHVQVKVTTTHPNIKRFWINQNWQAIAHTYQYFIP